MIDPATNFTAGAGMIVRAVTSESPMSGGTPRAERLALAARMAPTDTEAIEAVRRLLEEVIT
jgi:hypothetical protein